MTRRVLLFPTTLILSLALPVSPASADPIQMMAGSVTLFGQVSSDNSADLHGTQGFSGAFSPGTAHGGWLCLPCGPPGTPISLDAYVDSVDGAGTVEFGGATYRVGSIGVAPGDAIVALRFLGGPVVLPPLAPRATLSAPFELGLSQLFLHTGDPLTAVFSFTGRGTATLDVVANQLGDPVWELSSVRYDFEPVPEPASLLLVGGGMLALAARRHRRQARPR